MTNIPAATTEQTKATPCSVSFTDIGLYQWAKTYGRSLSPQQSASAVICTAVVEYRQRVDPVVDDQTSAALAQVQAAASKDATLAGDILQFIRDRKRSKSRSAR